MGTPTGPVLARQVFAYCAKTGTSIEVLAAAAEVSIGSVRQLAARAFPRAATIRKLTETMASHPKGVAAPAERTIGAEAPSLPPSPAPKVADLVKAEAEQSTHRRLHAASLSSKPLASIPNPTPAERVATLCVETPSELIATVRRQWPTQWAAIVEASRAAGTLPGAMLAEVIRRGIDTLEAGR